MTSWAMRCLAFFIYAYVQWQLAVARNKSSDYDYVILLLLMDARAINNLHASIYPINKSKWWFICIMIINCLSAEHPKPWASRINFFHIDFSPSKRSDVHRIGNIWILSCLKTIYHFQGFHRKLFISFNFFLNNGLQRQNILLPFMYNVHKYIYCILYIYSGTLLNLARKFYYFFIVPL